jgi:hypothetical protein
MRDNNNPVGNDGEGQRPKQQQHHSSTVSQQSETSKFIHQMKLTKTLSPLKTSKEVQIPAIIYNKNGISNYERCRNNAVEK